MGSHGNNFYKKLWNVVKYLWKREKTYVYETEPLIEQYWNDDVMVFTVPVGCILSPDQAITVEQTTNIVNITCKGFDELGFAKIVKERVEVPHLKHDNCCWYFNNGDIKLCVKPLRDTFHVAVDPDKDLTKGWV